MPVMAADDFGFYLQRRPGAFIALGTADNLHSVMVHREDYSFNDLVLPLVVELLANLLRDRLQ